jgi:hypothetical protein
MNKASPSANPQIIVGLGSSAPDKELAEKLMLFGQFVGDWDILEDRCLTSDGTWKSQRGELHWGWILGGKALQDVWMTIDPSTGNAIPEGTTIRFYNPKIDAWNSIWLSASQAAVRTFIGRKVLDEIVLEGETDGHAVKWIFSEITSNSFRWRAEETRDNRITWILTEEMRIRRRSVG